MSGWVIPVQYAMGVQKATRVAFSNCNEETCSKLANTNGSDNTGVMYLKVNNVLGFGI